MRRAPPAADVSSTAGAAREGRQAAVTPKNFVLLVGIAAFALIGLVLVGSAVALLPPERGHEGPSRGRRLRPLPGDGAFDVPAGSPQTGGGGSAEAPAPSGELGVQVRGAPPAPQHGAPAGRGEYDDLLDELMGMHRRDVEAREAATRAPEDLPVSHADGLVATMADGGYGACAVRLVKSVRGEGRWGGAVVVLVPTGEGSPPLDEEVVRELTEGLGATLHPVLPEGAGGAGVRGAGSAAQYGKNALLVEEAFRKYGTILFLDADGVAGAPLEHLMRLPLPGERGIALPTWPTSAVKHEGLWERELNFQALEPASSAELRAAAPDRTLVGITAWFVVKPPRLPPPSAMRRSIDDALVRWRPGFRFNDQGLYNVLFYNSSAFFPLCLSGPRAAADGPPAVPYDPFVVGDLSGLDRAIEAGCGVGSERRRPLYVHGLKDCIPQSEWERKQRINAKLPSETLADLRRKR